MRVHTNLIDGGKMPCDDRIYCAERYLPVVLGNESDFYTHFHPVYDITSNEVTLQHFRQNPPGSSLSSFSFNLVISFFLESLFFTRS